MACGAIGYPSYLLSWKWGYSLDIVLHILWTLPMSTPNQPYRQHVAVDFRANMT